MKTLLQNLGRGALGLLLSAICLHAGNFTVLHSFGILTNVTGFYPMTPLTQGPDGTLYGVTGQAEGNLEGVIFRVNPDGTGFQALKIFTNSAGGAYPNGALVLVGNMLYGPAGGGTNGGGVIFGISTNGSLYTNIYDFGALTNDGSGPGGRLFYSGGLVYGTTVAGGIFGQGTVFKIGTNGGSPTYLVNFDGANGSQPGAGVILSGSTLYGTTQYGGSNSYGAIFKVNTDTTGFSVMHSFSNNPDGSYPDAELILSGNTLYGTATTGGVTNDSGVIFAINTSGSGYTNFYNFSARSTNTDGIAPQCALVLIGNLLYGTTSQGGTNDDGTIFEVTTNGNSFVTLHTFQTASSVDCGLILSNTTLYGVASGGGSNGYGCLFSIDTSGGSYTNFFNFAGSDGDSPQCLLTLSGGTLYGTAANGGPANLGTLYRVNTDGSAYTNLYNFTSASGFSPLDGPLLIGNTLYGTTSTGTTNGSGSIFAINNNGSGFTNLDDNPGSARSGLTLLNGTLYGTTTTYDVFGNVYAISTNGHNWTNLLSFYDNGGDVSAATLVASTSNLLYGTTEEGAQYDSGMIFSIGTNGSPYNVLYNFSMLYFDPSINAVTNADGANPLCGVILFSNTLFGTTSAGGPYGYGAVYRVDVNGSNFMNLHNFTGGSDGAEPVSTLVLSGNILYGTSSGSSIGNGTVFSVGTNGSGFTVLHSFTGGADGANPLAGLTLSSNTLYGTASVGGNLGEGVVFSLVPEPLLTIELSGHNVILIWSSPSYSLQSAPTVTNTFTTINGATSPYTNPISGTQQYFRLISN